MSEYLRAVAETAQKQRCDAIVAKWSQLLKEDGSFARFGRAILVLNGVALTKGGADYLYGAFLREWGPDAWSTLAGLFKRDAFEGPAIGLLAPFLGTAYLTVGSFNLVAAPLFRRREAAIVLCVTGLPFHAALGLAWPTPAHHADSNSIWEC